MNRFQINKNRLDLEFRQVLQRYSAVLNARWSVPFATFGVFVSKFFDAPSSIFLGALTAVLVFWYIETYRQNYEEDLNGIKNQIKSLAN